MAYHKRQTHVVGRCWACGYPVRAYAAGWVADNEYESFSDVPKRRLVHANRCLTKAQGALEPTPQTFWDIEKRTYEHLTGKKWDNDQT